MKANQEEGEDEEGRCSLEGFLEEVRLEKKTGEDLDGRIVMGSHSG